MRTQSYPLFRLTLPRDRHRLAGFLLSAALHLALGLMVWFGIAEGVLAPGTGNPGPLGGDPGGGGGAGGGSRVHLLTLPPAPPRVEAELREVPRPVEPDVVVPELPLPVAVADADTIAVIPDSQVLVQADSGLGQGPSGAGAGPGAGGGSGGGQGGGTGTGIGPGTGPGAGGDGSLARNPEPRQLLLPPEVKDKKLRGQSFDVTFWVRADGRVERIRVRPALPDQDYARRFQERMEGYLFRPARSPTGEPISGTITITVSL